MSTRSLCRRIALRALAGLLSIGVVLAGLELATHDHAPVAIGWHDAAPHEHGPDGHALKSCSMCRLAHESGATPAVAAGLPSPVALPEARVAPIALASSRRPRHRGIASRSSRLRTLLIRYRRDRAAARARRRCAIPAAFRFREDPHEGACRPASGILAGRRLRGVPRRVRQSEPEPPAPPPPAPAPITLASGAGGKNYLNLSLDGLVAAGASTEPDVSELETGGHDPIQRGFTLQNLEIVFDGAVDPYFKAQANLVLQIAPDGTTNFELEEAYAVTTSLPHNLQVKAGQYLAEFGRINPTHPHTWDFVDQPLVSGLMFGPDGLRSVGARLSWLMPVPFYSEFLVGVANANGDTMTSFGSTPGRDPVRPPDRARRREDARRHALRPAMDRFVRHRRHAHAGARCFGGLRSQRHGSDANTAIGGIDRLLEVEVGARGERVSVREGAGRSDGAKLRRGRDPDAP
jgi:hypothetical protein